MADEDETELTYEEKRKQRVEENEKKMGELGLLKLAKSVSEGNGGALLKKSTKRKMMSSLEELRLEARRSSRVAAKPAVTYNDAPVLSGLREKVETRHGLPKQYLSDKPRMAAIDAAEAVFKDLRNPAFIKSLLHSHTSGGFWMGLQSAFCKEHLPVDDERIMLEANDLEWECIYLAGKGGLSGGWRGFSIDNQLADGDCCIFELVNPRRFVVHIFRVSRDESLKPVKAGREKSNKKAGKR
ncbi:B3 domain-containing protein At3g19184 [Physcomitrium patens]|uniref:TF-B3 domain-containing protein n=1 Tax=Physcomitrium patens TaxID=3218 RepID=A0A2K1JIE2_PHYPA|nr:B3 domain-containing protein At3g19184-like [Physcomitrium patens]PNR41320.1 hypothetical protein PHYPA_018723 [Physcomitrium patens]|eukprot:XP_024395307.1 B3 domain-containing protein At3g19184-like [Physcomitrella patens]